MKNLVLITGFVLVFGLAGYTLPPDNSSMPLIGEVAPAFIAQSTRGTLNFPSDFGRSWKILFSHPADFTPVCTSEILELALMQKDFKDLDVKFAVLSTDELSLHRTWESSMNEMIGKYN